MDVWSNCTLAITLFAFQIHNLGVLPPLPSYTIPLVIPPFLPDMDPQWGAGSLSLGRFLSPLNTLCIDDLIQPRGLKYLPCP